MTPSGATWFPDIICALFAVIIVLLKHNYEQERLNIGKKVFT